MNHSPQERKLNQDNPLGKNKSFILPQHKMGSKISFSKISPQQPKANEKPRSGMILKKGKKAIKGISPKQINQSISQLKINSHFYLFNYNPNFNVKINNISPTKNKYINKISNIQSKSPFNPSSTKNLHVPLKPVRSKSSINQKNLLNNKFYKDKNEMNLVNQYSKKEFKINNIIKEIQPQNEKNKEKGLFVKENSALNIEKLLIPSTCKAQQNLSPNQPSSNNESINDKKRLTQYSYFNGNIKENQLKIKVKNDNEENIFDSTKMSYMPQIFLDKLIPSSLHKKILVPSELNKFEDKSSTKSYQIIPKMFPNPLKIIENTSNIDEPHSYMNYNFDYLESKEKKSKNMIRKNPSISTEFESNKTVSVLSTNNTNNINNLNSNTYSLSKSIQHNSTKGSQGQVEQSKNEGDAPLKIENFVEMYYKEEDAKNLINYIKNYYKDNKEYPKTSPQFYTIGKLLGKGAFGKVNLGIHKLTGRLVAIKSIHKEFMMNEESKIKVMQEFAILRLVNHNNVIK